MSTNLTKMLKIIIFILFLAPNAMAGEDVQVVTYMSPPSGIYKDLKVRDALVMKGSYGFYMHGSLEVLDNNDAAVPQGGILSAYGFYGLSAENNNDVSGGGENTNRGWVMVDPSTGAGVIGVDAATLSQNSQNFVFNSTSWVVRSKKAVGYSDPTNLSGSAAYQIDHTNDDVNNKNNGFSGVTGTPGVDLRHIPLHLDGYPLRFLVDPQTNNALPGQVVIRGDANPAAVLQPGHTARVVVGKASDNATNVASQSLDLTSMRSTKYDISYLDRRGYEDILGKLKKLDVVTFRYKGDSGDSKKLIGFIAEEAPDEMTDNSKTVIRINDALSFLMASTKAMQDEHVDLKQRIEDLKK